MLIRFLICTFLFCMTIPSLAMAAGRDSWLTPESIQNEPMPFTVTSCQNFNALPNESKRLPGPNLVTFDIRSGKNTYHVMQEGRGRLILANDVGVLSEVNVAPESFRGEVFYRFTVERSLIRHSEFAFHFGGRHRMRLVDWHSPDDPLTAEFVLRQSRVSQGDTLLVELAIASVDSVNMSFGSTTKHSWKLTDETGEIVAYDPMSLNSMYTGLIITPDSPHRHTFVVPTMLVDHRTAPRQPLLPGTYRLHCRMDCYGHIGLFKEFDIEVKP